jgi:hypothetical protein
MVNRYSTPNLDVFIAGAKEAWKGKPEYRILSKLWKAFNDAGNPIRFVDDGDEMNPVDNKEEFWYQVLNLDDFFLCTATGQWVRIVMGNEWDALIDYVVSLEGILSPVNDWIDKHN